MHLPQRGFSHIVFIVLVAISVSLAVLFFFSSRGTTSTSFEAISFVNTTPTPTSSRIPFEEMTIPGLRKREYVSSLGDLVIQSENASYTSYLTSYDSDGLKINGLLMIPKGEEPVGGWPGLVFVHGYIPPEEYSTTQNYVSYADYFAKNGFVVFKIDLRGHDQSEGEAGGAYYSEDYVVDTLNAYAALESIDFVDPKRIGLWGHSMAGNVTFRAFVAKQNIPAIVIWAGAVYTYEDMAEYSIEDNSYRPPPADSERAKKRQRLREAHGDFNAESAFWKQVVPTNYLDGVTGALQLHHALNDNVVDIGYSRNLVSILDKTNIVHELVEHDSGGHNLTGNSFTNAMRSSVEFFRDHL